MKLTMVVTMMHGSAATKINRFLLVCCLAMVLSACGGGGGGGGGGSSAPAAPQPPAGPTFTLSGEVIVTGGSVVDGDVNDVNAAFSPNDTLPTVQDIPNPVNVGGYVNQPGEGEPGRSRVAGDPTDLYRISVVAGQRITLIIGDASALNDLDLFLGDNNGNVIDSSEGVGNTETIISSVTGTYLIEVFAFSGASNYVLTVSQELLGNAVDTLSTLDDFVPGDLVVRFNNAADVISGSVTSLSSKASAVGLTARSGAIDRAALLGLDVSKQAASTIPALKVSTSENPQSVLMQNANIDARKIETIRKIKTLRRRADIKYAEPNYVIKPLLQPNDQFYSLQWHYPLINLPQAWDITTGSSDVIVAVIDTGVILTHPDLQGRLIQGYDFISSPSASGDGDGLDNNPDDPGDPNNNGSSVFHGTHVAGTIGAATNNVTGISGITWSTSIMPLRVLGPQGGTSYDVSQAIRYAAGLANDSGTLPAKRADVINLSLGGGGFSQQAQDLVNDVRNQGVIVIAAAGNDNSSVPFYPASYDGVVSVSAVDINKSKASYSNFGVRIDVAAPGGDGTPDINGDGRPDMVLSSNGDDSSGSIQPVFEFLNGTSMASPHVAGVAALMKAVNPALTPAAFDSLLSSGQLTEDLGVAGRDNVYGHGLIDAHKAVVAAGGAPVGENLVVNPAALNFGTIITGLSLNLENSGGDILTVNTLTDDAEWLTVTQANVDVNGNGSYTVAVSRAGLVEGTHTATITITSSANTVSVPVIMQVSSAPVPVDAGFQYVLLIDAETEEVLDESEASAVNGRYFYSFNQVAEGSYLIISGSDSNNNTYICDAGESCGAYLTLDQPSEINVNANQSLNDFPTAYIAGFSGLSNQSGSVIQRSYRRPGKESALRQLQR